jgi:UDP-glucose 4-epimerase
MESRKVLVTGGAGFIGAHVSQELLKAGHEVIVLDDLSGGFRDNVPEQAMFVEGSILDVQLVQALFRTHRFDYVFHLAAYAAEGLSHFIKRFNYENNVIGSINLINESVNCQVKCFVFTSSIAVYGTNQLPMREDLVPNPEDSYGIAKLTVEKELEITKRMFGLNYIIFRPHNVYGEKQNLGDKYRNVIGIFMNQMMQHKPVTIFGDGEQTRAFSYIGDVAPRIAASVANNFCYNEIFNIGADQSYSINQLVDVVARAMDETPTKVHLAPRNEVTHAYADHSKVENIFPLNKATSLEAGIQRMARWARLVGSRKSKHFENIEIRKSLPQSWSDDNPT